MVLKSGTATREWLRALLAFTCRATTAPSPGSGPLSHRAGCALGGRWGRLAGAVASAADLVVVLLGRKGSLSANRQQCPRSAALLGFLAFFSARPGPKRQEGIRRPSAACGSQIFGMSNATARFE